MSYDYIIIGAGSAGATLAARLSEDPAVSVLLLEAGPDYRASETPVEMQSPNFWGILQNERFFWPTLKARATAVQEPSLYWRGRGLGGSSAINAQVAIRGLSEDYDRWAQLGCIGWSYAEVLPSFIRLEDDLAYGARPYHGRGGPIPIYRTPLEQWGAVDRALREASLDFGYGWADDHNAPDTTGVSPWAWNSRDGRRVSTNDAYLEVARSRPNLTVTGEALVDRVAFANRRATGVRVRTAQGWTHFQGKEVVLCAGAIHSPAILLRSGIGPADELRALGIPPLVHVPGVGQNLGEHPAVWLTLRLRPQAWAASTHTRTLNCCVRYASGVEGTGPNDMLLFAANLMGAEEAARSVGGLWVAVMQTFSRGRLRLATPDPETDPQVDFGLLSDERDLVRLRDGVRRLFALSRHSAVSAIAEDIRVGTMEQGIEDVADDARLDEWLRRDCMAWVHVVGTCRMGSVSDPQAVVDPECRVIGVEGLRVIDASVMPEVPRANTHLTAVMIAEHMAARMRRRN